MTNHLPLAKRWNLHLLFAVLMLAAAGQGMVGCASHDELPPQMTQNLVELRDLVVQLKAQVQTTTNAARDLVNRPQAQLQPQIDRLTRAITDLDDLATNNRKQFATSEEQAQTYFVHWDRQMQGLSESLAERGQERRSKSMASFDELKSRAVSLKMEFRPYMASLHEGAKYLATDTTAAGIKAVTPQLNDAMGRENSIMKKADDVIAQIDAMRGGK